MARRERENERLAPLQKLLDQKEEEMFASDRE